MSTPVAAQLAGLVERLLGAPLPVRIRAWDGSEAGAATGPALKLLPLPYEVPAPA